MTHDAEQRTVSIDGLGRLIDIYGADRARWPARERLRYSGFVAESAEARRMLAEAEALEAVLDHAPEPEPQLVDALTSRIMAAAASGNSSLPRVAAAARRPVATKRPSGERMIDWPAAALLAASLVVGLFAGTSGVAEQPLQSLAALTSSETVQDAVSEDDAGQAPFAGDEEDIL